MLFQPCSTSVCLFDKTATMPIIFFEIIIGIAAIFFLWHFSKFTKHVFIKFGIMAIGIFIFEFITHPLWYNYRLGSWAYVYRDVSWILTIGWSILFLGPIVYIDHFFSKIKQSKRFFLYLSATVFLGLIAEVVVVKLGIRSYSPETHEIINGLYFPFIPLPVASLYFMPVFMSLVAGFYKYWSFVIDKKLIIPVIKRRWKRDILISFIGVLLFELMIDAMIKNNAFPSWSYIWRDISLIQTCGWVFIIWLSIVIVDKIFIHFGLFEKFLAYIITITFAALPIEAYFVAHKIREYSVSTIENFSGFIIPFTSIPAEVIFVFPFYLALIVGFIKYWVYIIENKDI